MALRSELSLLELSGGTFSVDRFEHLTVKDGLVVIDALPAGDYDLLLKATSTHVTVRVTSGDVLGSFIVGGMRQLETKPLNPLQIESITPSEEKLTVTLQNASKFARLHVFATRYLPEYDAYGHLSTVRAAEPYLFWQTPAESVYLTGRNIGDEYRYIIDRKYATKYPGNMLDRPSLLLNPWAVRDTETGEQIAATGGQFGQQGVTSSADSNRRSAEAEERVSPAEHFADLDFLASAAAVLVNLVPDDNGIVEIPRTAFGPHQHIHVVAVDPLNTTYRSLTLPEPKATFVDLRLANGLDPQGHFTQQKRVSIVPVGQTFTLHDIATAKFESYDSLSRVYALYATLNNDPKLAEFSFLLNWPKLKPEEKRDLYSKYASHELSFFLFQKDPDFFLAVIKPYLVHKKDKTFMDHFLLEADLAEYLEPWKYGQLNIVERILLAQRIDGERERTSRHVGDLYALLPSNMERFVFLFDTAVRRSALEIEDATGVKDAVKSIERLSRLTYDAEVPAADAPMAAPALAGAAGNARGALLGKKLADVELQMDLAKRELKSRRGAVYGLREDLGETSAEMDAFSGGRFFDNGTLADRKELRQLYRKLDKTREWAEDNYYHLTMDQQTAELVTVNAFWKDFATHDPSAPFLSRNMAEASRNFPEILLALAVLDLPFEAPEHESKFDGTRMTLIPGGPLVVFHEEIQPSAGPTGAAQLLVSQNFFRYGDRQRVENGETVDKFVTDEFLIHTVYGCQVVVTNPTSTRQRLNVLIQIPRGSIAVLNGKPTSTFHIELEPYHTQTVEYHFYFPSAGQFVHFPVHVAKNEQLVAVAEPATLNVVDRPTRFDTESWDYVSQYGSLEDVVNFLHKHNIDELNLDRIAWRMHDRSAFDALLPLLTQRHVYQHTLWSYSLLHNAVPSVNQYLQHADQVINECGGPLRSTPLSVDTVERRMYEHLEYKPLVNARTHALGRRRQIVNDRLHWQYHRFLKQLAYQRSLDDKQLLAVTYYLLLQDRVEEALETFARVDRAKMAAQMQYDYCAAYLKFFTDEPEQARAIAARYADHPVDRWRNTFAGISAQLDEAMGKSVSPIDAENRDQQQAQLAATEPNFDFTVEARKIRINYQNLAAVKVSFYEVDVELLFSRSPFVQQFGGNFASIKPNRFMEVALPHGTPSMTIDLPETLKNSNVLIEIVGAGETKTQPYFSNSLAVQIIENYGQVKVTQRETHKPVAKAYVKVYAQSSSGQVKFYKDGYTDLRGRFDYASLNTNELDVAQKFAILVLSDEHGALVREAAPPKR